MGKIRIGHGYDVHVLTMGVPMRLGGVDIECDKGCLAHSDGDVAVHALCDALLGAAALGDIGKFFPDTSGDYRGIDSTILLGKVVEMLAEKEFEIQNVDITIALEAPKLRGSIDKMRSRLADVMGIGEDYISVKATSTEQLGFVGRGEGVEAHAVVLIREM